MNKSKRELMEIRITELMNNCLDNENELIPLLGEYKTLFPTFKFTIELLKKEQTDLCSGYCLQSKKKYPKNELNGFGNNHPHLYCLPCIAGWIRENLYADPLKEICCQMCVIVNKPGPTFTDNDICTFLQISPQELYDHRSQYAIASSSIKCSYCSNPMAPNEKKNFLCMHEYCYNCLYYLIKNNLDYYIRGIYSPDPFPNDFSFTFPCHHNCNLSVENDIAKYLQENLNVYQGCQELAPYIQTVSKYPKFFSRQSFLAKCQQCRAVYEIDSNISTCKNCGKCVCGKQSHPGISCADLANKDNKYTQDPKFMLPQPPEGDAAIVKIFAILSGKMTEILQVPRRIAKVWKVHNTLQDYYFSFAKPKKNIMTPLMLEPEYQSILQTNFQLDEKGLFSFPMKINNFPEKKFMFYLEVMFDEDMGQVDPDTIDESKKNSKMIFFNHAGRYCLNNIRSIRIDYVIELI